MKQKADLVSGWMQKAENDFRTISAAISVEAYDTACFHAQQAAEKALKAVLINWGIEFPFTHNLSKLLLLCAAKDSSYIQLQQIVEELTPFAVELRYDAEFLPEQTEALEAKQKAETVMTKVRQSLLPQD